MRDVDVPYKTLGYPATPFIFILAGTWVLINTLQTSPIESGVGLILILSGIPLYLYLQRVRNNLATPRE